MYVVFSFLVFGYQYQCYRLPVKTRLRVEWDVKPYTLTQLVRWPIRLMVLCSSHYWISGMADYQVIL